MIFLTGISREKHKNIVQMIFAFSNKRDDRVTHFRETIICESFVFDFMPDTLGTLIENNSLDNVDIKLYTWQMFNGLQYLSRLQIMHRDIKPVNILADHAQGLLKIGDFGSAKIVRPGMTSTPYQVTRFYRPPELLLGAENYNWTIDIWSAGCVLGEMVKGNVLFPGRDTKHQLKLIRRALGSPTESDLRFGSRTILHLQFL
uniref:Protein kinase domain-containing protein n=1 Tax=Angiostrongylus cantonensis TaxID=6313 RepID=A0A0K0DMK2_ANGCA